LAKTYLRQGRLDKARKVWEEIVPGLENLGPSDQIEVDKWIGFVDLAQNRPAAAKSRFLRATDTLAETKGKYHVASSWIGLARAHAQLGEIEAARTAIERAKSPVSEVGIRTLDAEFLAGLMEVAERGSDYKLAYQSARKRFDLERAELTDGARHRVEDMSVRFDLKLKDADNQLLTAREADARIQRIVLSLGLMLSALIVAGASFLLAKQARQRRLFETLALKDELTGAPNRRSVQEHLRRAYAERNDLGLSLFVGILDIDHFKQVNDVDGHDAGDAVLKAFYQACRAELRPEDVIGRWGGEEFVVVTRLHDEVTLQALYARLSNRVKQMHVAELKSGRVITFSMGACRMCGAETTGIDAVLARADAELYAAKEAGRARCHVARQAYATDPRASWNSN